MHLSTYKGTVLVNFKLLIFKIDKKVKYIGIEGRRTQRPFLKK